MYVVPDTLPPNDISQPNKHGLQHQRKTQPQNNYTVDYFMHIHDPAYSGSKSAAAPTAGHGLASTR